MGKTGFTLSETMGNDQIKPERTSTWECGTDLRFLNNRITLDFTWFYSYSRDLILSVPVSPSTGFRNMYTNAGEMSSQGFEVILGAQPVKSNNWSWDILLNFTRVKNVVEQLAPNVDILVLGGTEPVVAAQPGSEYQSFLGYDWLRDESDNVIIDDNYKYTGSTPGSGNASASWPGPAIIMPDAPTYFITYAEVLFTKAECLFRLGYNETEVKEVLIDAVESSMLKYEVLDDDWMMGYANLVNELSGEDLFKEIMTQKYIATFGQSETFHSWRRTGIPVISPNPNGALPDIPRRFPYSVEEQVYNSNMPAGITISDRVWWDMD